MFLELVNINYELYTLFKAIFTTKINYFHVYIFSYTEYLNYISHYCIINSNIVHIQELLKATINL